MAEPIKQSLFTFNATRAAELLTSEAQSSYFIHHFDGVTGDFFLAVANMGISDVKRTVLETTAQSFSQKSSAELIALASDIYNLGKMLVKERKTLTVAEATAAVSGLTPLNTINKKTVWDNLFYQLIT